MTQPISPNLHCHTLIKALGTVPGTIIGLGCLAATFTLLEEIALFRDVRSTSKPLPNLLLETSTIVPIASVLSYSITSTASRILPAAFGNTLTTTGTAIPPIIGLIRIIYQIFFAKILSRSHNSTTHQSK